MGESSREQTSMSEQPPIPPPSRLSWLLVAFAVLVLGGLAAAYWWVGQSAPADAESDEADDEAGETTNAPPPQSLPK